MFHEGLPLLWVERGMISIVRKVAQDSKDTLVAIILLGFLSRRMTSLVAVESKFVIGYFRAHVI